MKLARLLGLGGVMVLLTWQAAIAQPVWPKLTLTEVPGTFNFPTHVTHAGDKSDRLFIVERKGVIRILQDNQLLSTPFLDIQERVGDFFEGGLLSVAFPPDYETSGVFYVYYSSKWDKAPPDGSAPGEVDGIQDTIVSRFHVTADLNKADPTSEEPILVANHPYPSHYGGQLAFGPDGYLYISNGDGGDAGDPFQAAQQPDTLLGKLLRIDVSGSITYSIPISNPFNRTAGYRPEIWALGLRNPWRFSFDRLQGDLYISDVGQYYFEEINFQPEDSTGGENYGWNVLEGSNCYNTDSCDKSGFVLPVAEYRHDSSGNCSVIGGHVYRGVDYPTMAGIYFYGDYCTGRIWGLRRIDEQWETRELLQRGDIAITTFGEDEAGNLYVPYFREEVGDYSQIGLYRLGALPTATITLTKTVIGQTPATAWQFNGGDDIGAFEIPAAGGSVTFTVATGVYTVTEMLRNDYTTAVVCTDGTTADSGSIAITLTVGVDIGCTFTNTQKPGTVAGRVYMNSADSDQLNKGDGIQNAIVALEGEADTPEAPPALHTASLRRATYAVTTTTAVDGSFVVTDVPAGTYTVTVTLPAGFVPLESQMIEVMATQTTTVEFVAMPRIWELYLPAVRE